MNAALATAREQRRRRLRRGLRSYLVLVVFLFAVNLAGADHCADDPLNLNDCLRSSGYAEALAGTAAIIVSVLVNGSEIVRTVLRPEAEEDSGEEEPTEYTLDLRTEDQRTTLVTDGEDSLTIEGSVRCNDPEKDTAGPTQSLAFTPHGLNADWLQLDAPQMRGAYKSVRVTAGPPSPDSELTSDQVTVIVSTTIEGRRVSGPVQLTLDEGAEMEVTILE